MSSWAEIMIVRDVQKATLQDKINQEKKQEANVSAMHVFLNRYIDNEWFWKFIAYTYFVCKTLGLLLLIDVFIFGRPTMMLLAFVFLCCCYINQKLYKLCLKLLPQH